MHAQQRSEGDVWDVPYLPIDPKDVGRTYEAIIRVNSQSGKGGVAFLLSSQFGLELPRGLQVDFAQKVQAITDAEGGELAAAELYALFEAEYLSVRDPYELLSYRHESSDDGDRLTAQLRIGEQPEEISADGNGPIAALVHALAERHGVAISVLDYHEHAMSTGKTPSRPRTSRPTSTASTSGASVCTRASSRLSARGRQCAQPIDPPAGGTAGGDPRLRHGVVRS
jgi:2-isopropylmalate synthase